MTVPITPETSSFANSLARTEAPQVRPQSSEATSGPRVDFAEHVRDVIDEVNGHQQRAQEAAEAYANGQRNDVHGTMIAVEQADITFRLVTNIRGRLVEAYREVMRMGA